MSPQAQALKQLKFAYLSAIVIIILLLFSAQLLIQLSLREETQVRTDAQVIDTQSLRLQALEQDTLNLFDKTQDANQNYLLFKASERVWEQTHQRILTLALSPDEESRLQAIQPFYLALYEAYHTYLRVESNTPRSLAQMNKADQATLVRAFRVIFYTTPADLRGLVSITTSLNFEADTYVAEIQIIELVLFCLSLLTLLAEWVLVIRPANTRLQWQVAKRDAESEEA